MLTSNFAFLNDDAGTQYILPNNCSVRQIEMDLFNGYGHLGFSKNFPASEVINRQ